MMSYVRPCCVCGKTHVGRSPEDTRCGACKRKDVLGWKEKKKKERIEKEKQTTKKKETKKQKKGQRIHELNNKVAKLEAEIRSLKKDNPKQRPKHEFYDSPKWRAVRYEVLRDRGRKCEACGSQKQPLHIDHIKPRSKYPELQFDKNNLQVLCVDCNLGKSNKYEDDWRRKEDKNNNQDPINDFIRRYGKLDLPKF